MSNINPDQQGPNGASMDITNILNTKGGATAAQSQAAGGFPQNPVYHQQLMHAANADSGAEAPSERSGSPHGSEQSTRYSGPPMQMNGMMPVLGRGQYPNPEMAANALQGILGDLQNARGYFSGGQPDHDRGMPIPRSTGSQPRDQAGPAPPPAKAFPCSVCQKGFARRSDLARHGMLAKFPLQ